MNHERAFRLAQDQLHRGQVDQAIETLAEILGESPDEADAHALLALCLVRKKRLHAARLEATRSLELEPDSAFAHVAVATCETADRRFTLAERHLQDALALVPDSTVARYQLAWLYLLWGREHDAAAEAETACGLQPDDAELWALRGRVAWALGDRDQARQFAAESLEIDPEQVDALVLLGELDLAAGDVDAARQHAAWALHVNPEDYGAITLIGAIKARQNLLLGLWWRFQSFVSAGSRARAVALLVGIYVLYRISVIMLEENGMKEWAPFAQGLWLAFCVYTWVAPSLLVRALEKELAQVRLRSSF